MMRRLKGLIFLVPIAISAALQMLNITRWSFWFDESFTGTLVEYGPSEIISRTAADVHPPLYYLLLKAWAELFGYSDLALRSFSVLATAATLFVLWRILMRITTPKTALIALSLASINPYVIRYGQEARMYALAGLAIAISTLLLIRIVNLPRDQRSTYKWALYALSVAATIYIHYFAVLAILSHLIYLLRRDIKAQKGSISAASLWNKIKSLDMRWLVSYVAAFILFIPWLPTFIDQLTSVNANFWIEPVGLFTLQNTALQIAVNTDVVNDTVVSTGVLMLPVLLLAAAWYLRRGLLRGERQYIDLLAGILLLPMIFLFAVSLIPGIQSVYYVRYFSQYALMGVAGLTLLLALILTSKVSRARGVLAKILVVVVIATSVYGIGNVYSGNGKSHFGVKTISQQLQDRYLPGDIVVAAGIWEFYDVYRYTSSFASPKLVVEGNFFGGESLVEGRTDIIIDSLDSLSTNGFVWYVASGDFADVPDEWLEVGEPIYSGSHTLRMYKTTR